MNEIVLIAARTTLPAIIAAAGERASLRFLEFFAANIRNPHTRRAYSRAVGREPETRRAGARAGSYAVVLILSRQDRR